MMHAALPDPVVRDPAVIDKIVPHSRLTAGEDEVAAVAAVVRSGEWAGGRIVAEAEAALARILARRHAVGLASGLAALRLGLASLGVGRGDEVLVPAYSCVALANAVLALGARPVPVDVLPGAYTIDPERAGCRLSRRSRAIVAVNTFGMPADVAALEALGLPVIEDCSHGFARDASGRPFVQGRLAALSFYATKLIACGEGGAVVTADSGLAGAVRDARDYTDKCPSADRLNDKMTDIAASLLSVQLDRLGVFLDRRAALAERYRQRLAGLAGLDLPGSAPGRSWYRFVVRVAAGRLEPVIAGLREAGITAARPVEDWVGPWCRESCDKSARFPVADAAFAELVSLPLYPTLGEDEQERVCRALESAVGR